MDDEDKKFIKWCVVAAIGMLAILAALDVIGAYFESRAYNRLTGAHTTTWDAFWLDLRVMDSPKTNH
jgi:hypothetical protein